MTKIVLLVVDALRKDVTYGDRVDTPNIDRLISKGYKIEQAYANGPSTAAAFPAILASSKINDLGRCPDTPTVAEALQDDGFETIGISTNPNAGPYNGYGRGFDHFEDFVTAAGEKAERSLLFRIGRRIVHSSDALYSFVRKHRSKIDLPYERAEVLNDEFFSRLEPEKDQFFFIHYMETHNPYLPPEEFADTSSEAWVERYELNETVKNDPAVSEELTDKLWELYEGELRYLDHALGELFERLEELDEEVVLIFTADHGDQFGEHGAYLHPANLRNVQLNVPFIVDGLEVKGEMASHLDIGPTLLGHVGGEEESFEGIDLTQEERRAVTVNLGEDRCVVTPDWKLLEENGRQSLFASDDYLEENDLAEEKLEVVQELEPMLEDKSAAVQGIEV